MPLFKTHPTQPEPLPPPPRKGSIFARPRSLTPPPAPAPTHTRGFFGRRRSSDDSSLGARSSSDSAHISRGGSVRSGASSGFFGRNNRHFASVHKDPTILAAREKVAFAEKAEAAADQALLAARAMVKEAKAQVLALEREAAEEHKRAKAKQAVANDVSRSAAGLGRHSH
ncbi:hypothetical protein MKEN_00690100 [Mycena kentingensis (nom. inval.)]|nr:hypothetical protein MKEN_00690100 [Mycena kentingensis (nom. inval.)]